MARAGEVCGAVAAAFGAGDRSDDRGAQDRAGYLPIDPSVPAGRLEFMLVDAEPVAVITTAKLRSRLPESVVAVVDIDEPGIAAQSAAALPVPAADGIAYMIYTSGTTGVPKGVAITHHNMTQALESLPRLLPSGPGRTWSQWHSLVFDVSVWEIFGALLSGTRLLVVPEAVAGSPEDLHDLLVTERVDVIYHTPGGGDAGLAGAWSGRRWW